MQTFSEAEICPANDVIIDGLKHKPVGHKHFVGNDLSIMASPHWQAAFQDQQGALVSCDRPADWLTDLKQVPPA